MASELAPALAVPPHEDSPPRVRWRFIALYALGYTGTWLALLTPVVLTIAVRVRQLAPDTAARDLSLVLGIGAIFALIGNPLFGHLSDRTRSRYGMRRPWLIAGALCGALALLLIAQASTVAVVLVGWCLAQLAFNAVLAAMVAILPDQIPAEQRGTVSGVLAICLPIGQALGTVLVHSVASSTLLSFMLPALIGTAAVLLLAWVLPDRRLSPDEPKRQSAREWLRAFWVDPRQHPDFAWAWLSRFLLVVGSAFVTTYQPLYLIDKLGFTLDEVPQLVSRAVVVQAAMIVVFSAASGKLSDVLGRRKIFVLFGSVLYAIGLWLIALADSYQAFILGIAITGVGHGVYFGTDLALVTEVLPDRYRNSGKDLGILNIANALPQAIAPALGSLALLVAERSYTMLYVIAGCAALLSAMSILPLRRVR